jgi:opacity protein-like surface antigen
MVMIVTVILGTARTKAQSEGLTSSPYSLYGLGVINQTSIGRSNSLGHTGIGMGSATDINNLNPANFALTPKNSFFYDVGVRGAHNSYGNTVDGESKNSLNFSNLAFAFSITERLGMGITLVPYSDVGYSLLGIRTNIEGSTETFESNVTGVGGLNDLGIDLGYGLSSSLRLGLSLSFLFGNIEEKESFAIRNSAFQLEETTNYSGARLGLGVQYDIVEGLSLGATAQLPVSLGGTLKRSVLKTLDYSEVEVENGTADEVSDFKLPLELGFGLSAKPMGSLMVNLDYKRNFWDATDQSENSGTYKDQDIFGIGLEYLKNEKGIKYGDRIRYRGGFNFDNGYLAIDDTKIESFSLTAGVGFPLNPMNNSMINLSYSYGSTGVLQNILIRENYHLITLNLSLEDLWFAKRKIN